MAVAQPQAAVVPEIERFRTFLRFRTITQECWQNGVSFQAVAFLEELLQSHGLKTEVIEITKGYPLLLATLEGTNPELPSVLLNSHYDVVPTFPEKWQCDPFGAFLLPNGDIIGRGTQDMKCVCMQYIEAIGRLVRAKVPLKRTVHLCFTPDEETGGTNGMRLFAKC